MDTSRLGIVAELHAVLHRLTRDGKGFMLLFIASGWFLSLGVRLVYPALLPFLRHDYGLSLTMAGFLLTVLWVTYAIGQLPAGLLSDRIGEGRVMVLSTVLTAGTILLVIIPESVQLLFAGTALLGFGTALYGVARYTALSDLFPEQMGTAVGVTMAAGDAGNAILPLLAGLVAAAFAWQLGFGILVPLFVMVAVGIWMVVPARTSRTQKAVDSISLQTLKSVLGMLQTKSVVSVTIILMLYEYIWQSFTAFYPTYLIEVKGLSSTVAVTLFGVFFTLGIVVKLVSGTAYDQIGARRTLLGMMVLGGSAFVALPLVQELWSIIIVTVVASSILGGATVAISYLTMTLPSNIKGSGLGLLRTMYLLVGATSPLVFGAIADLTSFDHVFMLLTVLLCVMVIVVAVGLPEEA